MNPQTDAAPGGVVHGPSAVTTSQLDPAVAARLSRLRRPKSSSEKAVSRWSRWLHVYTSMISLMLVLFFGISGITLNHPTWTFGDELNTTTVKGTFPFELDETGNVDFLQISEYVRTEHGITADVADYRADAASGLVSYRGPGYSADVIFDTADSTYEITTDQQGWVGVMNDLHKGRDTTGSWKWVIDVSAGLLVLVSVTGLVMQFFLAKRRRSALIIAGVGTIVGAVLIYLTLA